MTDQAEPDEAPKERLPPLNVERGDIVQITDEGHPWYPALLIVDEIRAWGVQACVLVPHTNQAPATCNQMWNRLRTAQFTRVGRAEVITG